MNPSGHYPVFGGNGINGYHDSFLFEEPRIVIGRVGAYCGCVHSSPAKSWVTDNALYIAHRDESVEFEYLIHALTYAKLNQYASQSGQPLISGSRLYSINILVPPSSLQQTFAARISTVERLKVSHRASLAALDELFASLQHRAFRGEL